jgi:hypothetical protein
MEQSTAASPWLLLLCLAAVTTGGARAQTDSKGTHNIKSGRITMSGARD